MSAKHVKDEKGICWIVRTVKGEIARILCGRASYESAVRCDEHSPLKRRKSNGKKINPRNRGTERTP